MPDGKLKRIVSDISVLYELSLAVGQSLDLHTNCEHFLRILLIRKNFAYGAVWLRKELLNVPSSNGKVPPSEKEDYALVCATPQFRIDKRSISEDHPILQRLHVDKAFTISSRDKNFADYVIERKTDDGVFATFPLGDIGFLRIFSVLRKEPFLTRDLNQLRNVISQFTTSIEGCLAHQELLWEIAERKQAEEALRHSEEKYRNVVERASDGIIVIQDGLLAYVNSRVADMAKCSVHEMIGSSFSRFIYPSEVQRVVSIYQRRMKKANGPSTYETVLMDTTGDPIDVELNAGVITFEGKQADLVFVRDITPRKKYETDRARLVLAIEQTADAVIITDTKGTILYVNPAFERITGYDRSEVLGKDPSVLKSNEQDPQAFRDMWSALETGKMWRGRLQNKKRDESIVTCDIIITPTRDDNNAIIGFVSVMRDVTRELQIEEQYLQAQKMESIGRLAGGIAHDFNNIMTAILGFGTMILDQVGDNHNLRHAVEQIVSAGERATNLTRQLLTFSRKQITEVRTLDVNAVIIEMYQLLRRALGEDVELITELEDDVGSIRADAGLIQQVVMNLAINAKDAMPRGGTLTIRTKSAAINEAFCREHAQLNPGRYILLSIRDTGFGMSKDVIEHVFEPFYTTKPKGKGTGLGLATVYGVVQQCNGHIEIESEAGQGTTIKIWLPVISAEDDTLPVELEERVDRGNETLLVVEDEELVRDLTLRILRSLGYQVLEACNGLEGLEIYRKSEKPIDLVLTDVVMPRMGGPEMVENLMKENADIKVLYTSGFTEIAVVEQGKPIAENRLIQKPYSRELLAEKIRWMLDN